MNIQVVKWAKFVAYVSGGGLTGVFAFRSHDPASWGIALIALAGAVGTLLPSPAVAISSPTIPVVTRTGKEIGTNVTAPPA